MLLPASTKLAVETATAIPFPEALDGPSAADELGAVVG